MKASTRKTIYIALVLVVIAATVTGLVTEGDVSRWLVAIEKALAIVAGILALVNLTPDAPDTTEE